MDASFFCCVLFTPYLCSIENHNISKNKEYEQKDKTQFNIYVNPDYCNGHRLSHVALNTYEDQ